VPASSNPSPGAIGCLVLAAGEGRRFGGPKQLAELAGRPLLEHALAAAEAAELSRVVVVLGAHREEILARVDTRGFETVACEDWRAGMSEPLKRGIAAVADLSAALILLGDQPLISAAAIRRVVSARRPGHAAVRATYGGKPGHPVLLERPLFEAVTSLRGDAGARSLLGGVEVVEVACEDVADPLDVDVPEDIGLAELKMTAARGRRSG
jgi:molybdenum cofactor cytidylyltransferase